MAGSNLTYRVTGRYMSGSNIASYHLVGEDGSQIVATKERVIYMIGQGKIENMRLQVNGDNIILRGKGVNLNNLPVYDVSKESLRDNSASQSVASHGVAPKKDSNVNKMGQLEITKRIMYKTNCLGYIVLDGAGRELKLSRKRVIELASQRLISNAIAQKYTPQGSDKSTVIIRGVGCDMNQLPIVQVDEDGNIIEAKEQAVAKPQTVIMRAIKMKRGGIIYDNKNNKKIVFRPGDFILCGSKATLRSISSEAASKMLKVKHDADKAICDDSLDNLENFPVEMFGSKPQCIQPNQVKRWPIVEVSRSA